MKAKISKIQYFFLIPNIIYGKAIGITSGVVVRAIGADVWTAMIIGFIVGTAIIFLTTVLGLKYPEKTIIEYSEELLGPIISKFIGVILAVYFGLAFAISANVITLHLKEYFLPETPFILICAAWGLLSLYGVWMGVEVVIRFALFGFLMTMFINITMILGTVKDFRIMNLQPILDQGILANIRASTFLFSDITMAILGIAIIFPMVNRKENIIQVTLGSMILSSITVIIWPIFEVGVLGADVMKQFVVVCMQQVRSAQLTRYLPRYELIMVSFFVWGVLVQSSLMFFCSMYSIKQITKVKRNVYILIPLTIALIIATYYQGRDHNNYVHFLEFPWAQISLGLGAGLPLILLGASIINRKT